MDNNVLNKIIKEEMTKSEISSLITNKIDSKLSSREFEKIVKEISTEVINNLFKVLWQRNNMWKHSVKS